MAAAPESIRIQIRGILLADWDPSNASGNEAAHGEYDADIDPLRKLIQSNASEEAIVDYLFDREREFMCVPPLGKQRLVRVARRLAGLRSEPRA